MSYTLLFVADFGPAQTGLTLNAQLYDDDGTPNGAAITTGFVEVDSTNQPGVYSYKHTAIPDGHRGTFGMYKASDQTIRVPFSVNPEEAENIDAALSTLATAAALADGTIVVGDIQTDVVDADALAADAVDEILDEVVEGALTLRQIMRILLAASAGVTDGAGTTNVKFKSQDEGTDRIDATVDADGERTAVTVDGS